MLLCIALWYIDMAGIISAPNPEVADLWGKIFRNGLLFIPPTLLQFSSVFTHPQGISGRTKKILLASYAASCFFAVINWTPYFTGGIKDIPLGISCAKWPSLPSIRIGFCHLCHGFSILHYSRFHLRR